MQIAQKKNFYAILIKKILYKRQKFVYIAILTNGKNFFLLFYTKIAPYFRIKFVHIDILTVVSKSGIIEWGFQFFAARTVHIGKYIKQ